MSTQRHERSGPWLLAALGYLTLALFYFWPVAARLTTGVPNDLGDPLLNTWIAWWNGTALPLTERWWNAPAFWPLAGAVTFSEHLLGAMVFFGPLRWVGTDVHLSYNLVFLASWPLAAVAAYWLCYELSSRHDTAFVGGLVYGFAPYRLDQVAHIQTLLTCWMPLSLVALHKFNSAETRGRRIGWILLFGAMWLCQVTTNGYLLFYFSLFVGFWLLWYRSSMNGLRDTVTLALAWALFALPLLPLLASYRAAHSTLQLNRTFGEIASYGADLASFATSPVLLRFWSFRPVDRPEQALYPGVVALLVIVFGAMSIGQRRGRVADDSSRAVKRARIALLLLGTTLVVIGMLVVFTGGWSAHVGALTLSVRRSRKPFTLGLWCLLFALLTLPSVRDSWRRRSDFAFYTAATLLTGMLCMGPTGFVLGEWLIEKPPYYWLMKLPGSDALRVPTRFAMIASLTFAVCVCFGLDRLRRGFSLRTQHAIAGVVVVLVVIDCWPSAIAMRTPPEKIRLPGAASSAAVLELPIGSADGDVAAMYRGIFHGRPVVNGYSGYSPAMYNLLVRAVEEGDQSILPSLSQFGSLCVVVDTRSADGDRWRRLAARSGARLGGTSASRAFYVLDRSPRPAESWAATAPIAQIDDGQSGDCPVCAMDGTEDTAWSTRDTQRRGHDLRVTLWETARVSGVRLSLRDVVGDYPRRLAVFTSVDGVGSIHKWEGGTAGSAYVALALGPQHPVVSIRFEPGEARYVLLRQEPIGETLAKWSIAEMSVLR